MESEAPCNHVSHQNISVDKLLKKREMKRLMPHHRDFILPLPLIPPFLNSLKGILLCTYIHIYINDKKLSEYGSVLI